jgi:hypothetical protein
VVAARKHYAVPTHTFELIPLSALSDTVATLKSTASPDPHLPVLPKVLPP